MVGMDELRIVQNKKSNNIKIVLLEQEKKLLTKNLKDAV